MPARATGQHRAAVISAEDGLIIVDPHHHLWDLGLNYYPWLVDEPVKAVFGPYEPIRRNYGIAELRAESRRHVLTKSVHIQTDFDPGNPVGETAWLQSVADDPASNRMPNGIVAFCNFADPDALRILEGHARYPNLRGIRHILNHHTDPVLTFTDRDFLDDAAWLDNFALLQRFDLSFDLQLYAPQMPAAARLANRYPSTQIILNHTGMPHDRSKEGIAAWRDGMRRLAACDNVACKISGLGMLDHRWTVDSIRPFVLDALSIFGTDRSMFASNFPVDRLFSDYDAIWDAFDLLTADLSADERHGLFVGNAEKYYRI
ncbi:MAG: amidohydrolase family protein [Rhizobiales bacterium]|nr:amidohydrolase family protein [Hyphomicrobiales bacterium]